MELNNNTPETNDNLLEGNKPEEKYEVVKNNLKKEGISFYTINVENQEFYISDISRETLKKVGKLLEDKPVTAFIIILNDIFLGGDREVFDDANLFLSVMPSIAALITPFEIEVTELINDNIEIIVKNARLKKDRAKCILNKKLTPSEVGKLFDMTNLGDTIGAGEYILSKKWISGDEEIKTDNRLFLSVLKVVSQMINVKAASIKKN